MNFKIINDLELFTKLLKKFTTQLFREDFAVHLRDWRYGLIEFKLGGGEEEKGCLKFTK